MLIQRQLGSAVYVCCSEQALAAGHKSGQLPLPSAAHHIGSRCMSQRLCQQVVWPASIMLLDTSIQDVPKHGLEIIVSTSKS